HDHHAQEHNGSQSQAESTLQVSHWIFLLFILTRLILGHFGRFSEHFGPLCLYNTSDTGGIGYKKGEIRGKIPEITPKKFPW
ncbi:MAG: hypothetical protein KHX28_12735, partial [Oscillospiraceae bacterium]|nr:hypothetical protein [Oscillospiraceae bacterium]